MSFLTGKAGKSVSENAAYPWLQQQFGGMVGTGGDANDMIAALLGAGGDATAANGAFNNYLDSTGYNFALDQGSRAITGNNAARGLLKSGATAKALTSFGQNLGKSYFDNYLNQLGGVANRGLQAGGLIGSAGQRSTSTGGTPGLGGAIGQGLSMIPMFSDPRLKADVEKLGELSDGLGVYSWRYIWDRRQSVVGVMADEVARLRPWALGPRVHGFMTVHYDLLEAE